MNQPDIKYYALFEDITGSNKTAKYAIKAAAGYYPPMDELKGRDGRITVYLGEKISSKASAPAMRLQAKDSLTLTGLKDYFVDGKISGFAYGYPYDSKTFGNKNPKPNPFADYADDAFLFVVHQDSSAALPAEQQRPKAIEMIVLDGAKVFAAAYCKQLQMGGFDKDLELMRKQAKASISL